MRAFLLVPIMLAGCKYPKLIHRQSAVYESEIEQYHNWSVSQASHLRRFIEKSCACESGRFSDKDCSNAAEYVLTVEYRAQWHKQMSLWNAGIVDQEPPEFPPEIPPVTCPLPIRGGGQ